MSVLARVVLGLLAALLAVGTVVLALEAVDRARVDTAAQATAVGEPGCVTAAELTGPDGVRRTVDVRVFKANCLDADPGDPVTVYYAAADPAVTARSRSWWWPASLAMALAGAAASAGVRAVRGARHAPATARVRPVRWLPSPRAGARTAAPAPAAAERPRRFLDPEHDDAPWNHDRALGRIGVLLDAVAAERSLPPDERSSGASDGCLAVVARHLEAVQRCVRGSAASAAEQHARAMARVVVDEMSTTSRLGEDLLALRQLLSR